MIYPLLVVVAVIVLFASIFLFTLAGGAAMGDPRAGREPSDIAAMLAFLALMAIAAALRAVFWLMENPF